MPTDIRRDPFRGFNYRLEIDGTTVAAFSEVSGLPVEGDLTEAARTTLSRPDVRIFANLTLKRGYATNATLWQWYQRLARGEVDRRTVSIVLVNDARNTMRWNISNAWISKIEGPDLKATSNEVAVESLELTHDGLTLS